MLRRKLLVLLGVVAALSTPPVAAAAGAAAWQLARLPAPEPAYGLFGTALALSGDTLAIEAREGTSGEVHVVTAEH